jgi:hypothetical protein
MIRVTSLAAVAALVATSAMADVAAISYSPSTGAYGYSYNQPDQNSAWEVAFQECNQYAVDCDTVLTFENACGALAVGEDLGWGTAWSTDFQTAENDALDACQQSSNGCQIMALFCSEQ